MQYRGGCHCGRIRFEVLADEFLEVVRCNCSICSKSGFLHLIVPKSSFTLLSGDECMSRYSFNTGVAQHTFCRVCGIKAFYTPRSNPDGIDVNVNCLDTVPTSIDVVTFDGQNWEQHAHTLEHKSRERE